MLTIRPRDYFDLKYDAAAQNKIDTLKGKTYLRSAVDKQVAKTITNVHLDGVGEVVLPYGPKLSYDYTDAEGGPFYLKQLEACLWHSQGIGTDWVSGHNPHANQCVLLGTFEVLFTGLNLPDGVVPTLDVRYEAQHEAYWNDRTKGNTLPSESLEKSGDGALITDDWENLWIGAGLRPTTKRKQSVDDGTTTLSKLRSEYALSLEGVGSVSDYNGSREEWLVGYASLGVQPTDAATRKNFMFVKGLEWSSLQDVVKLSEMSEGTDYPESNTARYLKGNNFNLATYQIELLNRDTCKVTGTVPIYNAHAGKGTWSGLNDEERFSVTDWVKALVVTLSFKQFDWSSLDFKYAADGSEDLYPYVFHNTRIANADDAVMGNSWDDYYPKLLLGKFAEGKYYATIKARVGFALANDIRVDTLVQIYDLNNQVISRAGVPCTFRVKRIVRSFGNNEFYYIINCLEE